MFQRVQCCRPQEQRAQQGEKFCNGGIKSLCLLPSVLVPVLARVSLAYVEQSPRKSLESRVKTNKLLNACTHSSIRIRRDRGRGSRSTPEKQCLTLSTELAYVQQTLISSVLWGEEYGRCAFARRVSFPAFVDLLQLLRKCCCHS